MRHCAPKSIIGFGMAQKLIPLAERRKAGSVHSSFHICRVRSKVYRTNTYIDAYTRYMHYKTNNHGNPNCPVKLGPRREKKERNNSKSIYFGYLWSNTFKQLNNNWSGFVVVCVVRVGVVVIIAGCVCVYANDRIRKSLDEWTTLVTHNGRRIRIEGTKVIFQ